MDQFIPFYKKAGFWREFVLGGFFSLFIILFWEDIIPALQGWWDLLAILIRRKEPPLDAFLIPSMLKMAMNVVMYIGVFLFSTFIVAQFVLPVETWQKRISAFWKLIYYGSRFFRGLAVFVHKGKLISRVGEEENTNPGVIIVDLRSAVVVEQEYPHLGEANFLDQPVLEKEPASGDRSRGVLWTVRLFNREDKEYPVARILGPGIHFTQGGEKIRTIVDLRKQARATANKLIVTQDGIERLESGVKTLTRDGIEISTNCSVVSSLSDPPDVIQVAYWGGTEKKDLHELDWEKKEDTFKVKKIYPLDPFDAEEIHQSVLAARIALSSASPSLVVSGSTLYPFDENRVFSAAYGQVYENSSNNKSQWHELPLSIAVDIFRNLLEKYNFDYLYSVDDPHVLPWKEEIKHEFSRRVKYQGILSYQLVRPAGLSRLQAIYWNAPLNGNDSKSLNMKLGEKISLDTLEFSASYPLTSSKPLRDRGIKVVSAGFSELKMPFDIREKLIERWKARWERQIQVVLARQEREVMQIISSARNQAQRNNAYFLANLFKEEKNSTEALALLLFQSLELAATDLKTHSDLPPKEVLAMLQNLHNWLLKERQEMNERKRNQKGKVDSDGKEGGVPVQ